MNSSTALDLVVVTPPPSARRPLVGLVPTPPSASSGRVPSWLLPGLGHLARPEVSSLKKANLLTSFLKLSIVLLMLFVGRGFVGQTFNPRPCSDLVPGGMDFSLQ